MSLKTYDRTRIAYDDAPLPWSFNIIDDDGIVVVDSWREIAPGKWVTHTSAGGKGMVIAVNDDQLTVLWSDPPQLGGFANIAMPLVRSVFASQIANQLVSVQPMSLPAGLIFYMDYTYGPDKWHQRCTTGPLPVRMFWRTCRSLRTLTTRIGSSLRSCWRSRFGKQLPPAVKPPDVVNKWARAQVTPDTTKAIVDEWVNRNAAKAGRSGIQGR